MQQDLLAKLDGIFNRLIGRESWEQAVQVRSQASAIAVQRGRTDLFRHYMGSAIELACTHDLQRLELGSWIFLFNNLLIADLSLQIIDTLDRELQCKFGSTGAVEVRGPVAERIDAYESSALAAYDALLTSPTQPLPALMDSVKLARAKAAAFSLSYHCGRFDEVLESLIKEALVEARTLIQTTASSARSDTSGICNSIRVDLYLLAAEWKRKKASPDTADDILRSAAEISKGLPEKQVNVYLAWADLCEGRGKVKAAIDRARKAVEASGPVTNATLKSQAISKLEHLLSLGNSAQVVPAAHPGQGEMMRVLSILDRAQQALLARRFDEAVDYAGRALEQATSPPMRRAVLRLRSVALFDLGRFAEAESDLDACISLLAAELSSDAQIAAGALDIRIQEEENFYLLKAFLRAQAGQSTEAWAIAEQGRSRRLKREIEATSGADGKNLEDPTFVSFRPWLHSKRAAMVSFAATPWGTLALTAGPDDSEPQAHILDQFPVKKLNALLAPDLAQNDKSTSVKLDFGALSAGLIYPLQARLQTIAEHARVLYIIPDSGLFNVPFSALTLENSPGSPMLVDLCPVAITPSTTILLWCAARSAPAPSRDCLAVAVGESDGFEFNRHLSEVAAAPWSKPPVELRDAHATAARVAAEAPHYPVLYFSCHGKVIQDSPRDLMAASELTLADKSLSAADVGQWKLNADLVFLNACQAGRFRIQARTDVTGFVRAFPLAGAKSLVAPLTFVDPRKAGELAGCFFKAWLSGASKAEALRTAQLAAREEDPSENGWATYCLVGDFL